MIKVEFRSLESINGKPTEIYMGSITLANDNALSFEPKDKRAFLRGLLSVPVTVVDEESGERTQYEFKKNPKGWMRNVCQMYRNYTFWASVPIEK